MPVFQLPEEIMFPPSELAEPNGLLAVGGDLSVERLIAAYRLGIFPWYAEGDPVLWWFTTPRLILIPEELRVSKRLQRYYRNSGLNVTINTCFDQVIERCAAAPRKEGDGTWITGDMARAYQELHHRRYAHSVECWQGNELVGGLYGVALGQVFFGESMFSARANSSKFALIHLVDFLKSNDYRLIDCQMTTDHLVSLGAREIPGAEFRRLLTRYITSDTHNGAWPHEKIC
jgi:leucyl/phenylalanyl-tRNA--protein transferase